MSVTYLREKSSMKNEYLYNSDLVKNNNNFKNEVINENKKIIIAGPCTFGTYEEVYSIAKELKRLGIKYFRAGAYKSRTSPYSFQGMQEEGIEMLIRLKKELDIKIVTELMTVEQVKKYGNFIDIIQVGTRNMYNYDLLKELGKTKKMIILKRGFMATYKEWLLSAEYILKEGNYNVVLCERGIRGFDSSETRNVLDIQAIPFIKYHSKLPIIIDPSHASGKSYIVKSMSKASLIAGADGLIIETHINPEQSLCDSEQTINIETLKEIIEFKERMENYEN